MSHLARVSRISWDVVVIGTGMGGSTLGYLLAKAGKRVLFLERGRAPFAPGALRGAFAETFFDETAKPAAKHRATLTLAGRNAESLHDVTSRRDVVPFIGTGAGGSTALYGMVLERFRECDFEPRRHFPEAAGCTLPERWPVSHRELEAYYDLAEQLFRVPTVESCPGLSAAARELESFLRAKGLNPYRLRPACEFVADCRFCQSYLCDRDCKNDAAKICLRPALAQYGAELLSECEVTRLVATERAITAVECRQHGQSAKLTAPLVVLAAGALGTPDLLLASASREWPQGIANRSGLVGRNLMRHFVDLYGIATKAPASRVGNVKALALDDFYLSDSLGKLGTFQSFGDLPPTEVLLAELSVIGRCLRPAAGAIDRFLGRRLFFASVLEDLPYADNQVFRDGDRGLAIRYQVRPEARRRIRRFRRALRNALSPYRALLIKAAEKNESLAHVCGTCRFGEDPATSVLDPTNRAHGIENLYVVDASFLPSSGGINPSLTVAANSLRVVDCLLGRGTVERLLTVDSRQAA